MSNTQTLTIMTFVTGDETDAIEILPEHIKERTQTRNESQGACVTGGGAKVPQLIFDANIASEVYVTARSLNEREEN